MLSSQTPGHLSVEVKARKKARLYLPSPDILARLISAPIGRANRQTYFLLAQPRDAAEC